MDYIIIYPFLVSKKRKKDENSDGKKICKMNICMPTYIHTYHIASNYGQSYINTCSHLLAEANGIITKINAKSRLNAGSFMDP